MNASVPRAWPAVLATVLTFLAMDAVWLTQMAAVLYQPAIGHLLAPEPDLRAAALFYALYLLGVVVFAVCPRERHLSAVGALARGALFGLVAYATYDLTNQATLKAWPWFVTGIDLLWGATVTGVAAAVGRAVLNRDASRRA